MASKTQWAWIGLLTILALVGCSGAGYAYPTLLGASGGVQTPSPQVVPTGQYDLAADYTKLAAGDNTITIWPIRLVAGVSERAELGIAYTRLKAGEGVSGRVTSAGGKFLLLKAGEKSFDLGVGANFADFGGDLSGSVMQVYGVAGRDLTPETEAYGEASKTNAYGYVGLMYSRLREPGESYTYTKPFVGLELSGQGGGSLALEWKAEEFGDNVTSAVLRYPFNPTLSGEVGITNNWLGADIAESHRVFVGLNYRFGVPKDEGWGW